MPNFITQACVKIVKSMGIIRGLNSALYSTSLLDLLHFKKSMSIKTLVFQYNLPINYTWFYTPKNSISNLLSSTFTHYPQHLLIRLKRKKKER